MRSTASDVLVQTLIDWGVNVVFGIPGDGINGLIESLRKQQDRIRFIQTRHEEAAAFMACAYAKWTGQLGVCVATSGPGGIHLLNGLYDAKLDGQPVLAITGLQFHDLVETMTQQDVELDKLYMDVAAYNARIMGAEHVENVVSLACRAALARRTVSHVTIPVDVQDEPVVKDIRSQRNVPHHVSDIMSSTHGMPSSAQLDLAASILNEARRPCILAGRGALGITGLLTSVADRIAAPVCKPLLGKATLPDDSPFSAGGVGLLGTRAAQEALEECDALLIAGSSFPYIEFYPKPGQAHGIQIDRDPTRIGLRYPVECALVGDTGPVLAQLLPKLSPRTDRSFLARAQKRMSEWNAEMEEQGTNPANPMKPQVVAHELNKCLKDNAIIATDSGTITTWAARFLLMRGDRKFSCSGNLATMACGLPYAIAAAIAHPERQVVAFVGDGGLSMLLGELATCVKYQLDIKIVVIKNNLLGQIKWEQMVFLGNPEYVCDLQPIDFAMVARGFGIPSFTIDDPAQCHTLMTQAMGMKGPVLVEAVVDPHEPPMPPKVSARQAANFAKSLARGTPHAGKIALTVASDTVREIV
jgi:pyruvate dehydrogenase (quinone)/pyruvate oxidase